MKRSLLATTALLTALASGAHAASVLQPGGTLGVAAGAPLPEGVFFNNISSLGNRDGTVAKTEINLTAVVWSTPFSFLPDASRVSLPGSDRRDDEHRAGSLLRQSAAPRRLSRP